MNCIIIEDQPPAQRILKKYIEDLGTLDLKGVFADAIQAMQFLQKEEVDLIFLDIHLPKISGIDFLKTLVHPPHVILTTAFSDYALESYEFNVVDFLLKPFSFQRFVKAVNKVSVKKDLETIPQQAQVNPSIKKEIFIKSGHAHIRIHIDEILFIKSDADYTELCLKEKRYLSGESLRHWMETLPTNQFVQVHKSFVINSAQIEKILGNQVFLQGTHEIPIGRAYKENFIERFVK